MNVSDSETISSILTENGFLRVDNYEQADIIVVNTCAVRDSAVSKVKAQICRFKPLKTKRRACIVVAGCLAEHEKESLLGELPIDFVVGPTEYRSIPAKLTGLDDALPTDSFYHDFPPIRGKGVNAWISIAKGCDNFCSYCVVPFVRGREKSKPMEMVLAEAQQAIYEGYKEITLLGQNVNSYSDGAFRFHDLLKKLNNLKGLQRLRFMTSHPKDLSDGLIECFRVLPTLCEYLHLPVQSGSDAVLKAMNRQYTRDSYLALVDKIRTAVPDIALSTDVLCGFPGESDTDHKSTVDLLSRVEFDSAFMFIYSPRKGTKAASMENQIHRAVKVARVNEIIKLQMDITKKKNSKMVGREEEVIIEAVCTKERGCVTARTRNYKNVILKGVAADIGKVIKARIISSSGWALKGEAID